MKGEGGEDGSVSKPRREPGADPSLPVLITKPARNSNPTCNPQTLETVHLKFKTPRDRYWVGCSCHVENPNELFLSNPILLYAAQ